MRRCCRPGCGYIVLPCSVRTVQLNILFKVAIITDHAILGMNFFDENECTLFLHKGLLSLHDQMLTCTNRAGEMLLNKVQAASTIAVPAGSEAQIVCRLSSSPSNTMGIVEHFSENDPTVVVAATLAKLNHRGKFLVRCLNAKDEPVTLKAGTTLGLYTPVIQEQVFQHNGDRKSTRLNSSHQIISYAVFCLKKKTQAITTAFLPLDLPHHRLICV